MSERTMAEDAELDELLESALADFDSSDGPSTSSSAAPPQNVPPATTSNLDHAPGSETLRDFLPFEDWGEVGAELDRVISDLHGDDPALANQLRHLIHRAGDRGEEDLESYPADIVETLAALGLTEGSEQGLLGVQPADEATIAPALERLLDNLLSPELLRPELQRLVERYPAWFDSHADSLSASDLARYRAQHVAMGKLLQELDRHGDGQQRLVVLTSHMEELQKLGLPPEDLLAGEANSGSSEHCVLM
uniref:peroxisomal biogenesis factor 19 isoform X2 n=1 Tax=Myxine glutinosa TaxID=7769 RepID=UPI00358FBD9C